MHMDFKKLMDLQNGKILTRLFCENPKILTLRELGI
jgi:hypothetical protein